MPSWNERLRASLLRRRGALPQIPDDVHARFGTGREDLPPEMEERAKSAIAAARDAIWAQHLAEMGCVKDPRGDDC